MRLRIKGKNVEVSEAVRTYAAEKLAKIERQLPDAAEVELELAVEKNPAIAASHVAEATIWTKGMTLRAREASADVRASIDQLTDKLERQVKRYREKRRSRARHDGQPAPGSLAPAPQADEQEEPVIVKSKRFAMKPMTPEDAVLQLELLGHDFFVFENAETRSVSVVYRRRDGTYGLIEPS